MKGTRCIARCYSTGVPASISLTLVLLRAPIVTHDLSTFEKQFYKYQTELWKRLMWTFPKWFYFKDGTISEQKFRQLNKNPISDNPDIEFPYGRPEIRNQRDRRFKQELSLPKTYKTDAELKSEGEEKSGVADSLTRMIVPNSRVTEADKAKDFLSLERKLSRTLYLLIEEGGQWKLPTFAQGTEPKPLHVVAQEGLADLGGDKINYFNVSPTPCHVRSNGDNKEYFIKSHILSGDLKIKNNQKAMWLTKDEIKEHVNEGYYQDIEHILCEV